MKKTLVAAGAVCVSIALALTLGGGIVRLPYYVEGPGPAKDVEPLISFSGHQRYASQGKFVLTTVDLSTEPVTPMQALLAWLDPNEVLVPARDVVAAGVTPTQEQQLELSSMSQSKIDATYVALTQAGLYPKEHGTGALIEGVVSGCPASGHLSPGEVVTQIDGRSVGDAQAASTAIDAVPVGKPIAIGYSVSGKSGTVSLTRQPCGGSTKPYVGVSLIDNFPFPVSMSSGDIGGPSAGLMWALGLYDLLTPGDLTGGKVVAGTGVIWTDGTVHPIGGVQQKVRAAEAAGAQVFLVPKGNYVDASKVAGDLKLVSVGTFQDALHALGG